MRAGLSPTGLCEPADYNWDDDPLAPGVHGTVVRVEHDGDGAWVCIDRSALTTAPAKSGCMIPLACSILRLNRGMLRNSSSSLLYKAAHKSSNLLTIRRRQHDGACRSLSWGQRDWSQAEQAQALSATTSRSSPTCLDRGMEGSPRTSPRPYLPSKSRPAALEIKNLGAALHRRV